MKVCGLRLLISVRRLHGSAAVMVKLPWKAFFCRHTAYGSPKYSNADWRPINQLASDELTKIDVCPKCATIIAQVQSKRFEVKS